MNLGKEILFFASAFGAINGFMLGIFLLFFTRKKYLANRFLGLLLIATSVRIAKSVCLYFDGQLPKIYLQIGLTACFFIGPFLYFFVKAATKPTTEVPRNWVWATAFLGVFILAVGMIWPYAENPAAWAKVIAPVIYVQWFGFLFASGVVLRNVLSRFFNRKNKNKPAETWISMIFLGNVIIFLFYFSSIINAPFASYISGSIAFSLILYLMITLVIYKKDMDELFVLLPDKPVSKKINESDARIWLTKLDKVMREKALYQNPDLKLHELSREIQVSGHQLSALLNEHLGKNLTTYVNEFRIEKACEMMKADHRFTLEAIGYEVGFNSKSTFFAAFKRIKGTTPSIYQQSLVESVAK